MRILPVLDVLNGVAVRGIGGRRAGYKPLEPVSDPLAVAEEYRALVEHEYLYVADLDAIAGMAPGYDLYEQLQAAGFVLWLDAGVRTLRDVDALALADVAQIVVGLETVAGPEELARCVAAWPERVVFSLDLKAGQPLTAGAWPTTARAVAEEAIATGVQKLLVLDLARVGAGQGTGTEELLRELRADYPEVELLAGGGVRNADDLLRLAAGGVSWVLVASALRSGALLG